MLATRGDTMDDGQVDSRLIKVGEAEKRIDTFFADFKLGYIHLRDGESGCCDAQIERDLRESMHYLYSVDVDAATIAFQSILAFG